MSKKCLICNNTELISCIDIGKQYLSSIFPDSLEYKNTLKKYPLELKLCRFCGLIKLDYQPDMSNMYKDYPYLSSSNRYMKDALEDIANSARALGILKTRDLILDIGGNDGTLLSFFKDSGYNLLNIDPAQNITPIFETPNARFVKAFFNKEVFNSTTNQKVKLIFSVAMFYHLLDPVNFCSNVLQCMEDDGVWIIQMAYLPAMIKNNMYDNIVHEHNGYYSLTTMQYLMSSVGLEIFDASVNDVYGGSFRVFVKKQKCDKYKTTERLVKLLLLEKQINFNSLSTYTDFNKRIKQTKRELLVLLSELKQEGKKVWVYGASTKGNTILQYCEIDSSLIEAASDANPFKYGKYMIGTDIPIKNEEEMRKAKPDYLLVLPYGFINNYIDKEIELRKTGTKFIVPLPKVMIYE